MCPLIMETKSKQFIGLWLVTWVHQKRLLLPAFACNGLPWGTDANPKMETDRADKDRPRIQIVDYVHKSHTLPHTNIQDVSPIMIPGV